MEIKNPPKGIYFLTNIASPFFHAVIAALALSKPSRFAAFSNSARRLDWRRAWVVSPLGLGFDAITERLRFLDYLKGIGEGFQIEHRRAVFDFLKLVDTLLEGVKQ